MTTPPARRDGGVRQEVSHLVQNGSIPETTRFAPSPTGHLHLGHAYAAWFAREAAGNGGKMLLRIEDIDPTRSRPEFVVSIKEDLDWLGTGWDGEVRVQSEHMADYAARLGQLRELGVTYPCFCTRKSILAEIERAGEAPQGPEGPVYPGTCRRLDVGDAFDRIASGTDYSLRIDVARAAERVGPLTWTEVATGEHEVDPFAFGDFVVARKETPTSYHLSVVVDDAIQGVTLVTRGADLRSATQPQRLLQALLGLAPPRYRHHGLVVDETGKRMAKRDASTTLRSLREAGWTAADVLERAKAMVVDERL